MKIEILFPELCCLYGDSGNELYLQASLPDAQFLRTHHSEMPRFLSEQVDLVYLGSMAERSQERAIDALKPHRDALRAFMEKNGLMLATGNSAEIFGQKIVDSQREIPALGLFDYHARRGPRHNSMFLGRFQDMKIVGARSQFSFLYGVLPPPLFQVTGGFGSSPGLSTEGFRYHNVFATSLLGPLLPLNPPFTQYLLRLMGCKGQPAFYEQAQAAYLHRIAELEQDGVCFTVGEHG